MTSAAPASLLTIFGATGDMARRMLLPSLYSLQAEGLLPAGLRILGTARSEMDREDFATQDADAVAERIAATAVNIAAMRGLVDRLDDCAASVDDDASMTALAQRVDAISLGCAVVENSAVATKFRLIEAPARGFESQDALLDASKVDASHGAALQGDFFAVAFSRSPHANGMPDLHKLTPTLVTYSVSTDDNPTSGERV